METSVNATGDQVSTTGPSEAMAWCVIFSLEALVVLVTNLVTIIVFLSETPLHKHTSILLTNLAFADLMVGLVAVPGWVYILGAQSKFWVDKSGPTTPFSIAYSCIDMIAAFASVSNHGCIAVERLVGTLLPFKYKRNKRKLNVFLIVVSWVCAVLMPSLTQVGFYVLDSDMFAFFVWMPFLTVLLLVITISYSILLSRMRALRRDLHHQQSAGNRGQRRGQRFTITAFIVTVVSLTAWLPFMIMSAINLVVNINHRPELVNSVKLLHFFNSLTNPFIYWHRIPHYKEAVYEVVCRRKRAKDRATVTFSASASHSTRSNCNNTRF